MEKKDRQILGIMLAYSLEIFITSLFAGSIHDNLHGFMSLLTHPAQLTIDYFKLGTVGGTFLNAGLVGLFCTAVFALSGAALNGVSLMAFFLTVGFSFFGMNLLNIWPCILGTWIFAKVTKTKLGCQVNIAMFSTSLSPFVSEVLWRYPVFDNFPMSFIFKLLLSIAVGAVAGFLMPILCQYSPNLHRGYSLYNAAAVAGFLGIMLFSFMYRAVGVEIPVNTDIGDSHAIIVNGFAIVSSLFAILAGIIMNGGKITSYMEILKSTGYKCDFIQKYNVPCTLIHIGIFGLFVTAWYNMTGAAMTGPTAGAIICLLAVVSCGAHMLNVLPIMIGYALASSFGAFELNTQSIIVGFCFSVALCPISGRFGILSGIAAGMVHAGIVTTVATFHGGMCLYNGGFTCGITAILIVPVLEFFFIPQDRLTFFPHRK